MAVQDWAYHQNYNQMCPQSYSMPTAVVTPSVEYLPVVPYQYMEMLPVPPPTILHTKQVPLKKIKSANPASDKQIGKSLSCYTKK